VYTIYCYKHADLAYATSACVVFSISNYYILFFTQEYSILKIISIGSTKVDPITAMTAYADVAYIHSILLTVAYMSRQHCKIYIKLIQLLHRS
jgi:hypothetical protein